MAGLVLKTSFVNSEGRGRTDDFRHFMTLKEENQWFIDNKDLCSYSRKLEQKIDNSIKCDYCGCINNYPWLVCENPFCYEIVLLDKQREENRKFFKR